MELCDNDVDGICVLFHLILSWFGLTPQSATATTRVDKLSVLRPIYAALGQLSFQVGLFYIQLRNSKIISVDSVTFD